MSKIIEIQEQLWDTQAAIAHIEKAIAADPNSFALRVTARSLLSKQGELESIFYELADQIGVDVCSYRLFYNNIRPTIYSMTKALGDFQRLFSVVYDSIKNGPKRKAKIGSDILGETSLGFGYAFSGSLGIVLTINNERLLLGETVIDKTVDTIFNMANSNSSEDMHKFVIQHGPPTLNALYQWANDHANSNIGARIEWRKGVEVKADFMVEVKHFEKLREVLIETTEEETIEFSLSGELVGADVSNRTFHIRGDDGYDIKGGFIDAINTEHTVELPKRYRFNLRKMTKRVYATDEEKTLFFLIRVENINTIPR
jgi:hypothetical protein